MLHMLMRCFWFRVYVTSLWAAILSGITFKISSRTNPIIIPLTWTSKRVIPSRNPTAIIYSSLIPPTEIPSRFLIQCFSSGIPLVGNSLRAPLARNHGRISVTGILSEISPAEIPVTVISSGISSAKIPLTIAVSVPSWISLHRRVYEFFFFP